MYQYTSTIPASKVISVRLDDTADNELNTIAKQLGISKNKLINQAIDHYIAMLKQFGKIKPHR